jgi:hypothetical protein
MGWRFKSSPGHHMQAKLALSASFLFPGFSRSPQTDRMQTIIIRVLIPAGLPFTEADRHILLAQKLAQFDTAIIMGKISTIEIGSHLDSLVEG